MVRVSGSVLKLGWAYDGLWPQVAWLHLQRPAVPRAGRARIAGRERRLPQEVKAKAPEPLGLTSSASLRLRRGVCWAKREQCWIARISASVVACLLGVQRHRRPSALLPGTASRSLGRELGEGLQGAGLFIQGPDVRNVIVLRGNMTMKRKMNTHTLELVKIIIRVTYTSIYYKVHLIV